MNNSKKQILALACLSLLGTKSYAALPQKYSYDQLDAFWTSQVQVPDMDTYSKLASQKTVISGTVKEIDPDAPPEDVMNGPHHDEETTGQLEFPAGSTTRLVIFPVISPTRATVGMMKRNAILQNYLGKERLYTKTGTIDQLNAIEQRRNAVQLELFLINLLRFAQAKSLTTRCQFVNAAQDLATNLSQRSLQLGGLPVPNGFESLVSTQQAVAAAFDLPSLRQLACSARTVSSKAELLRRMHDRVADRLTDNTAKNPLLAGYDDRQKTVMNAQLEKYTSVEQSVEAVDMMVSKLITMRDKLANIKDSYLLVKDDTFGLVTAPSGIQSSIQQLGAIPYPQLKIDFSVVDSATADPVTGDKQPKYKLILKDSTDKYAGAIGDQTGLKSILKAYVSLYGNAPSTLKQVLLPCSTILDDFNTVEALMVAGGAENADQVKKFKESFTICLTYATDAFVEQQKANESQYRIDDGFAKLLSILSSTVIDIKKRSN